jgi:hypothetical protein
VNIHGLRIIFDTYALGQHGAAVPGISPPLQAHSQEINNWFGSEYRKQPCMWRHRDAILACKSLRAQLEVARSTMSSLHSAERVSA